MLSIITVTWNNEKTIADQLRSVVLACGDLEFEQIVVDNNSKDNTVEIVKQFCHPDESQDLLKDEHSKKDSGSESGMTGVNCEIKLIENKKNLGFSKANNLGVHESRGDYILFLNPDMKLEKGSIKELLEYLKVNPDIGVISPKLIKENGSFLLGDGPRRFPRIIDVLMIFFKISKLFPKVLSRYYYKDLFGNPSQSPLGKGRKPVEVDSVRGAFMLINKKVINELLGNPHQSPLGNGGDKLWDERYFCWFEDVDLCCEIKKLGKKVIYYPNVQAIDMVGQSFKQRNIFWKQWTFFVSAFKYFIKWRKN